MHKLRTANYVLLKAVLNVKNRILLNREYAKYAQILITVWSALRKESVLFAKQGIYRNKVFAHYVILSIKIVSNAILKDAQLAKTHISSRTGSVSPALHSITAVNVTAKENAPNALIFTFS